jgi:hypothetical protein
MAKQYRGKEIASGHSVYLSSCCHHPMAYRIIVDAYVCPLCQKQYEVLSVEHDHVLYQPGPHPEVKRG